MHDVSLSRLIWAPAPKTSSASFAVRSVQGWGRPLDVEAVGPAGAAALFGGFGDVVGVDLEQARKLPVHIRMNARTEKPKRVMGTLPI
jgi:hypothetical protein